MMSERRLQKQRILKMFTRDEIRTMFRTRADDEMFAEIGRLRIGTARAAEMEAFGYGHLVVWYGYEYLVDFQPGVEISK